VTTTTQRNRGWIAAVGRACFRRRWIVLAAWLAIAVGGFLASGSVFNGLKSTPGTNSLESVHAYSILDKQSQVGDDVLGEVTGVDPKSEAVRTAVTSAAAQIKTIDGVRGVATPYDAGLPAAQAAGLTAKDGSGVLIDVTLDRLSNDGESTTTDAVTAQMKSLESTLRGAAPPARVLVGGSAVLGSEVNDQVQHDLSLAEELSLPITLVVLIFVFGGVVAAGLPVFAAILSVFAAMLALIGFEHVTDLDQNATIVVTLLGLGLSIDYGLLLVARYREELGHGFDPETALGRAWASAGRTILFSALTVAGSLCGLVVFGVTSMTALGVAGVSIACIAMLVALTATAALIGLGRKRIRPSRRARAARHDDDRGFFARLARIVQARPVVTVIVTAGVLLAAGLPLLQAKPSVDSLSSLPTSLPSVRVAHDLETRYGRDNTPAITVLAKAEPGTLDQWGARWATTPGVKAVAPAVAVGSGLSTLDIYVTGDNEGTAARELVATVRADRPAGVQSWVTGDAALLKDILGLIKQRLPWAVGITVLAMLILLFLMTGSLVVPVKAVVMNALSLGATVGVMTLVFQHGYASGILHTLHTGSLDPFVIVGVLAFAFGLSMDYEVFLLSRIKEYVDQGLPSDVAVRRGLQKSGRVITSAALLMVIVFGSFLVGKVGNTQQIGLGLAAAIAIDATLVRCVLVPATMTLLGRWNWWAPRPLARWHARWAAPAFAEDRREPDRVLQSVS
jgi:putative drug exporter of the RND superfamily